MTDQPSAAERQPAIPEGALDLAAAGEELLDKARGGSAGRAARTLTPGGGAPLKQTLLALTAGAELSEHASPGAATLQVLRGRAALAWGGQRLDVGEGDWAAIPDAPHALHADEDTVVLLTVARSSA